jgi:hypothetical protein
MDRTIARQKKMFWFAKISPISARLSMADSCPLRPQPSPR